MESGAVFWITGLAGSGKSTIAKCLKKKLEKSTAVLLLDGDDLRQVFSNVFTYSVENRLKAAQCYSRLCKLVSEQGIDVICPTISLFHEIHAWNKQNLRNYIEIYLDVPIDILVKEGKREFYQQQEIKDKHQDVAGIDFLPQPPSHPDIIINNREVTAEQAVEQILNFYFQRLKTL